MDSVDTCLNYSRLNLLFIWTIVRLNCCSFELLTMTTYPAQISNSNSSNSFELFFYKFSFVIIHEVRPWHSGMNMGGFWGHLPYLPSPIEFLWSRAYTKIILAGGGQNFFCPPPPYELLGGGKIWTVNSKHLASWISGISIIRL